jgi:hypothetical protein
MQGAMTARSYDCLDELPPVTSDMVSGLQPTKELCNNVISLAMRQWHRIYGLSSGHWSELLVIDLIAHLLAINPSLASLPPESESSY